MCRKLGKTIRRPVFTGIVQSRRRDPSNHPKGRRCRNSDRRSQLGLENVGIGDSIAVSGCCLTVTRLTPESFAVDVSTETLNVTTLKSWRVGSARESGESTRRGAALGGHYVTGHVDGVARVVERHDDARSVRVGFEVPPGRSRNT